jgi:hypothetical protein
MHSWKAFQEFVIGLDISSKGFLRRRRLLNVNGMVQSTGETPTM